MRRFFQTTLILLASAGILALIVYFVGFNETIEALKQAGPWSFLVIGILTALPLILQSLAWQTLNKAVYHEIPLPTLFSAVVAGMAMNIITPSSYLGGEPLKVYLIGKKCSLPYTEVAGTVVLSKYLEGLSFLVFFDFSTIMAAVVFKKTLFTPPYLTGGIALLCLATALFVLSIVLWMALSRNWRPLTWILNLLLRFKPNSKKLALLKEKTADMEDQVSRVFLEERTRAFQAFIFLFLSIGVVFLKPLLFFGVGFQLALGIGALSLIFVASQALLALQFTPSGVGSLDGGLIGTFALFGLAEPKAMAFLLCLRFWDGIIVGAGTLICGKSGMRFFSHVRGSNVASPVKK